jgi:gas vesicle protein
VTDKTKTTLYFLGGAAVGVGLGILFAPKPGKETRQEVKKWIGDKTEKGKELWAKGRVQLAQQKDQLAAAFDAGKKAYQEAKIQPALKPANHRSERHPVGV